MNARILCRTGQLAGETHHLGAGATLGRGPDNDVVLHSRMVSDRHARIWLEGGEWWVEDLGSLNGTSLDGERLAAPARLDGLHVINLAGEVDFVFVPQAVSAAADQGRAAPGERPRGAPAAELPTEPATEPTSPSAAASGAAARGPEDEVPPPPEKAKGPGTELDMEALGPLPELQDTQPSVPSAREAPRPTGSAPREDETSEATRAEFEMPALPDLEEEEPPEGATRAEFRMPPLPDLEDEFPEDTQAEFPMTPLPDLLDREGVEDAAPRAGPPEAPPGGTEAFTLKVVIGGQNIRIHDLEPGETVLGRDPKCDIPVEDEWLSRAHAVVTVEGGRVTVSDRGSLNGTFVGDERISTAVLRPGDSFRLGPHTTCTLESR